MKILLAFLLFVVCRSFTYNSVFTTQGHTNLVTTASFFLDGNRFITGSKDNKVKIWSLRNFSMLHQLTFADEITNVGLHPVDNRIFVLVYDGTISVHDPTTYAVLTTFTHPTGNGNYMTFDTASNRFLIGGYDGAGAAPSIHYYDSTSYAHLSSFVTGMPVGDQINTISMNAAGTHIAIINSALTFTTYKLQIYRISDNTLISAFTHNTDNIRWAIYDNTQNIVCTTSRDLSIRCYNYVSGSNSYVNYKTWNAATQPYCMNFGIEGTMLVTIGTNLVFYSMTAAVVPPIYKTLTDTQDIFVLDSVPNMTYLITGKQTGSISIWKYDSQIIPVQQKQQTKQETANIPLIVGLSVGLSGFVTIAAILVYCCFCGGWAKWKKEKNVQDQLSRHQFRSQLESNERIIVIKDQNSDISSDLQYDQLMAMGTVIVIKDDKKKDKYLKQLLKRQKGIKADNNQISIDQSDLNNLRVQGNIIIIRDDNHPLKKSKKNQINSQTQPDLDYQQLMAQGNIIIIKDKDQKQKLIKKLKQKGQNTTNLYAQDTIIIIKGDQEQKQYLKQLQKQKEIKNIKHDRILANGDILVIKDQDKKKQYIENTKKEMSKVNGNGRKENDFKMMEIAEQIIVIRGDDDVDQNQDITYEQLMAQGTVIVIKDDDVIKEYAQFLNQQKSINKANNKGGKSQKSSQPDYETLMAEQCIIVIKEDSDRENYVKFMKYRRSKSDRSSNISYDELVNGNVMQIQQQKSKNKDFSKRNSSGGNIRAKNLQPNPVKMDPFKQLMAQKNVVVINQQGQIIEKDQQNLQKASKSINMRK